MIKYIHISGGVEFMNILIVEDERDIRNLISLHMRKETMKFMKLPMDEKL